MRLLGKVGGTKGKVSTTDASWNEIVDSEKMTISVSKHVALKKKVEVLKNITQELCRALIFGKSIRC